MLVRTGRFTKALERACATVIHYPGDETMKLICRVTSNQDCDLECDYALIDLNSDFARSALRRIAALKQLKAIFPDLWEMYFWLRRDVV
jgi:hypothetical protein